MLKLRESIMSASVFQGKVLNILTDIKTSLSDIKTSFSSVNTTLVEMRDENRTYN